MDFSDTERNMGADDNPARDERFRQRLEALVPDMLRRTFYAGLGAIFTSEEGIRRLAHDFSLPKDVASYLVGQAQSTKNELFRIFAAEIRRFLEDLRFNDELRRLLASMAVEVKAEIRFMPREGESTAPVKSKVKIRRRPAAEPETRDEGEAPPSAP